jgi:hypothetical protein
LASCELLLRLDPVEPAGLAVAVSARAQPVGVALHSQLPESAVYKLSRPYVCRTLAFKVAYTSSLRPHALVACIRSFLKTRSTSSAGVKLLVHEALSYLCMRP